ncbi:MULTISPECIES: GNAT family N-acetyltransferase [Paenibacillus]|uniref:GCN5-related N-acetyltransferase n=1 Tax=Paenibacillus lactis 154 TaxID=743719 RepID=G4H7R6_9BACL|nr:GNAT family N-acetyltransferase [Paenibacillus lactis]EHB67901.1 GCN5-related N-acetyltransferase [Paenibacillus lactis 154]MCM3493093.1 GNAT family N-acetyltransferase [Paenibacillus lactis]
MMKIPSNQKPERLRLTVLEPEHLPVLSQFSLPEHQRRFTLLPDDAMKKHGYPPTEDKLPVVLLAADKPVAFFVLDRGERIARYTPNQSAVLLRALSVDHKEQGRGYGQAAMRLLPEFIRSRLPGVNEIALAVNDRNEHARHVYLQAGFRDRGYRVMGVQGIQHILHLDLEIR